MASLPPMPLKTPVMDESGMMNRLWIAFFQAVFNRIGGTSGSSTTDIATTVTTLQASVTSIQSQADGLSQGRAL